VGHSIRGRSNPLAAIRQGALRKSRSGALQGERGTARRPEHRIVRSQRSVQFIEGPNAFRQVRQRQSDRPDEREEGQQTNDPMKVNRNRNGAVSNRNGSRRTAPMAVTIVFSDILISYVRDFMGQDALHLAGVRSERSPRVTTSEE